MADGDQTPLDTLFYRTDQVNDAASRRLAEAQPAGPPAASTEEQAEQNVVSLARDKLIADAQQIQGIAAEIDRVPGSEPIEDDDAPRDLRTGELIVVKAETAKGPQAVANMLMARQNAAEALDEDTERRLVDYVQACFEMSYDEISKRYDYWTEAEQAHDLYVPAYLVERLQRGRTARPSNERRFERTRIVDVIRTPYARAIVDVKSTYMLAIFGGMPPFRIDPAGPLSSVKSSKIIEQALSANMRRVGYEKTIYQWSLDQARYGMSPTALYYGQKGNEPVNVDPWNYFPDPRVTIQNSHEADFIGFRSWGSRAALERRRMYKCLHKLDSSSPPTAGWKCNQFLRDNLRGQTLNMNAPTRNENRTNFKLGRAHIVNTLYCWIDPQAWFEIPAPPGIYRITVMDEKHVCLFDTNPYPHKKMPLVNGAADYDGHKTFSSSTYDLMMPLQRFQDWLLRARVDNVQNLIQGRMVVDPQRINVGDILNPNAARLIRTLPGADPQGAVLPVNMPDATKSFWQELDTAGQLMQRLGAANDTAQGIQSETERTATEIARITSMGQQRLGTQSRLMSATMVRDMVGMMVENLQYFGVAGGLVKLPPEYANQENGWYQWSQNEIMGSYDYVVTDGTLPVDPRNNTEILLRALRVIGETGLAADFNLKKLTMHILQMLGFVDIEAFQATKQERDQQVSRMEQEAVARDPSAQAQIAQAASAIAQSQAQASGQLGQQVMPTEQVMRDAQAGNVIPLSQAAQQLG